MLERQVIDKAAATIAKCRDAGVMVATVESCTGGLVSAALTAVAGSSAVVDRGFVTYTNEAKSELVGVPAALIEAHGAVSAEVAEAMARGGLSRSNAQIAVSLTGIAGPGGGTETKPVGLVHFACAREGRDVVLHHEVFPGDRAAVRQAAVLKALELISTAAG
jgi:nicotinamide-nucleotide amidase